MRAMSGRYSAISLLVAAAAFAAGCGSDSSTAPDPTPTTPTDEFEVGPDAIAAAQTATLGLSHRLKIVQARSPFSNTSPIQPDIINSPFDLTYFGGPVVQKARSHNVFVNCPDGPAACWGTGTLTPTIFLNDLNGSQFIRTANEFIGTDANGQFPASGLRTHATFAHNTATVDDIVSILFAAVTKTGVAGYGNIYHVFLPQGTDMCLDATTCYSPDNFDTFVFCAFHGSVDFGPTHVLFSVEPYQFVDGCAFPGQTPHGVIDATASTLSHELIETMTDPDGNAWFNALFGQEIADICFAFASDQVMNGRHYVLQSEYSNKARACVSAPTT